jgi:diaminohydroxyphosphoribosylaminopyrimidine deaminase / 5-amino-6-(5-phosphoribosylamino)uracil reductase
MATDVERTAMLRAVALASTALGVSNPNPAVGAVVLDAAGAVAGEGATRSVGHEHAEVVALAAAGAAARGATLVVTLEPCRHAGRTAPCTDAILDAGVARVVFAVADPHDAAAGGAEQLRAAGVDVEGGLLAEEASRDLEPWIVAVQRRRPHVTWKYAATLDGRTAAADGTSRWITGDVARAAVHRLRATCDAVLVGSGTVLADDPQLTVRDEAGRDVERQPLRVVVDRRGRVPAEARVFDDAAPTHVSRAGSPAEVLAELFGRGVRRVLLEGGPELAAGFLRAGLIDEVVVHLAPKLLGAGPSLVGDLGIRTISDALSLDVVDVTLLGSDVAIRLRPTRHTGRRQHASGRG